MGRGHRIDVADVPYHVLNRANGRAQIFFEDRDYIDFEYLLNEMRETYDMRILSYEIMPNHWHQLLYPKKDGDLARALQWLCTAHARRFRTKTKTVGYGHVYQGRYKSFDIKNDAHLLSVLKYIERNSVRANLVQRAEDWRWGSAYRRLRGSDKEKELLSELPAEFPSDYVTWINYPEPAEELKAIRESVAKSEMLGGNITP